MESESIAKKQRVEETYEVGQPTAAVVEPGKCQFGEEFVECELLKRIQVSPDTYVHIFRLPDESKPLNLSTCACILAGLEDVVRPYTPVSTNAMIGKFELMIKIYPDGNMTQKLIKLPVGGSVKFKHIPKNVKLQYPFNHKCIGMLVGGTGITPMIQALHAILGSAGDKTIVKMLYGSKTSKNILGGDFLDKWMESFPKRFEVTYVLSEEPENSKWEGDRGFITGELIEKKFPGPSEDIKVFVCGPPPMYKALCGPREDAELSGALADLGYNKEHVFKF